MKRMLIILFALSFALGTASAFAGELSGVITETKCGAAHKAGTDKDISCIKSCAKSGAGKLALLAGDTIYTITNPEKATIPSKWPPSKSNSIARLKAPRINGGAFLFPEIHGGSMQRYLWKN